MASPSRFPRRFVDNCNDNDVIFGRGKGSYNNPGNKELQNSIRHHFPQYDVADLQTKTVLAHKVVDAMTTKKPPSRFLKADKDTNRWYEMSREEVVKKIKQDFANLKSAHKRKIEGGEDEPSPIPDRKRPALITSSNRTVASSSLMQRYTQGTEPEVRNEVAAIMAVVNQVFVHNPRLDHQKQAEMILSDDAVKEAIISILEFKAEQHAEMLRGRMAINPHTSRLLQARVSSIAFGNSSTMPLGTSKDAPAVKTNAAHMESVCNKVHFAPKIDEINNITPMLKVKDDRTYTGSVMNSSPHGVGFMKFDDGRIYCGAWRKGKLHGNACVLYKNGDRYLGQFSKNKRIGEGVCYYNDGAIYQGRFENDRLNGKGAYRSHDGNVYEGEFVNGKFEGVGVHKRLDGTELSGRFVNWTLVSSDAEALTGDGSEEKDLNKDQSSIQDESNQEESSTGSNTDKESQGSTSKTGRKPQDGTSQYEDANDPLMEDDDDDSNGSDGSGKVEDDEAESIPTVSSPSRTL